LSGLHLEFVAVAAGVGVDLIILVAGDLQDHLLADRDVDLLPLGSTSPLAIVMLIVSADGLAKAGAERNPGPAHSDRPRTQSISVTVKVSGN
jgi:hypothetical protein